MQTKTIFYVNLSHFTLYCAQSGSWIILKTVQLAVVRSTVVTYTFVKTYLVAFIIVNYIAKLIIMPVMLGHALVLTSFLSLLYHPFTPQMTRCSQLVC